MNSDRWRREWRGSERDRDRVGGTEGVPKSLTQKKVLANFFVPGLSILVVVEILEGGWEERAAVGSMPCNDSTVLRVAQTAEDRLVRCNGTAELHRKSDTSITLCAVPQHVIFIVTFNGCIRNTSVAARIAQTAAIGIVRCIRVQILHRKNDTRIMSIGAPSHVILIVTFNGCIGNIGVECCVAARRAQTAAIGIVRCIRVQILHRKSDTSITSIALPVLRALFSSGSAAACRLGFHTFLLLFREKACCFVAIKLLVFREKAMNMPCRTLYSDPRSLSSIRGWSCR